MEVENNIFWNRISELYYEYELSGEDSVILLTLTDGSEVTLSVSDISIGGDVIMGLLDDDTELMISIDSIIMLQYNVNWSMSLENFLKE